MTRDAELWRRRLCGDSAMVADIAAPALSSHFPADSPAHERPPGSRGGVRTRGIRSPRERLVVRGRSRPGHARPTPSAGWPRPCGPSSWWPPCSPPRWPSWPCGCGPRWTTWIPDERIAGAPARSAVDAFLNGLQPLLPQPRRHRRAVRDLDVAGGQEQRVLRPSRRARARAGPSAPGSSRSAAWSSPPSSSSSCGRARTARCPAVTPAGAARRQRPALGLVGRLRRRPADDLRSAFRYIVPTEETEAS